MECQLTREVKQTLYSERQLLTVQDHPYIATSHQIIYFLQDKNKSKEALDKQELIRR